MNISATNITIHVKQLDAAISFYESIGFRLKNRWDNYCAQLTAEGITIGLHPSSNEEILGSSGTVSIGFTTADFEETKAAMNKLGIKNIYRKEAGGEFIHFTDPDGTALYFIKAKE